jgi:transglutaminase-like putative cysteine protease
MKAPSRQTLDRGWGACRDFAVLFVEAARNLDFGVRIVSGYLYNPDQGVVGTGGCGVDPCLGGTMCQVRVGSPSIRRTAASADSI